MDLARLAQVCQNPRSESIASWIQKQERRGSGISQPDGDTHTRRMGMFNGQRNPRAWYLLVICGVWSLSPLFAQDTPPATPAFVPPATLADLEAKVKKWEPQPVLDAIDWLRNRQVKYRKAQVSVEEALKLKNDTPENNAKILSALERLPESDEQGIATDPNDHPDDECAENRCDPLPVLVEIGGSEDRVSRSPEGAGRVL